MDKQGKSVIVVGGGASGLMAAIQAARCGARVTVLERENKPGRKLLRTGNGRCNLTNTGSTAGVYHGEERAFAAKVLENWTVAETLAFFESIGVHTTSRGGWIYPYSDQAESVLQDLLMTAEECGVRIKTREEVRRVRKVMGRFQVETATWTYEADAVILACGTRAGIAGQEDAEEPAGIAARMGHTVIRQLPALVPLNVEDAGRLGWAGVRVNGSVRIISGRELIEEESGQLQLTEYGISGIPVFIVSSEAVRLLDSHAPVHAELDFFPDGTERELAELLHERHANHLLRPLKKLLVGLFPEKLIPALTAGSPDLISLAERAKHFRVRVTGHQGAKAAQVMSGGVSTDEVDPATCMSRLVENLYLTGEMLDIDGACGGWNLQFAWSTGALAGRSAGRGEDK